MAKYLTKDEIYSLVGIIDIPAGFQTMSQDSYNEKLIADKIIELGSPKELLLSAINMAIVGYGNQKYGAFRVNDEIISIQTIFNKFGVKYNNPRNALLKENELTPQRLLRFYRHHIRDYIIKTKAQSYIYRKYSARNPGLMHTCFRGAEYLEDLTPQEATFLLESIQYLDDSLGTRIQDRVLRVYQARGQVFMGDIDFHE